MTRYDLGGHTHYKLDYHFVWRTRLNRRILGPVMSPYLVEEIESICHAKKLKRLGLLSQSIMSICVLGFAGPIACQ